MSEFSSTMNANSNSEEDCSTIMKGTEADKAADFANYFCTYAYLYHQKQMLMDHVRMRAYHSAIMCNKELFKDKIILDVGAGSGILSIWAAQAGASKVYAVEFTDCAKHAKALVASNGFSDVIEVMQCSAEDLELPCKADIIISEWMGYFLLRESMLDSVLRARNKWLKPEGAMFPSNATMFLSAITNEADREEKIDDYMGSLREWTVFVDEMKEYYDVDMGVIEKPFIREQSEFHIYSSLWTELKPDNVIGQPVIVKRFDLNTCTIDDVQGVDQTLYSINIPFPIRVSGFAGWFSVDFAGSVGTPAEKRVTLSTGPEVGYTHWGQQVFYLKNAIDCTPDTTISGDLALVRQDANKRLYNLHISVKVDDGESEKFVYEIP